MVAGAAQMGGDPLALAEHLDRAHRQAHLKLVFGEAVGHAVVMVFDLDMIVEPGAPYPPLGKDVGLRGQRLERRRVQFLEQLLAGDAQPAQDARPLISASISGMAGVHLGQGCRSVRWRRRPKQAAFDDQNAASTLALSLGCAAAPAARRCRNAPPSRRRCGGPAGRRSRP